MRTLGGHARALWTVAAAAVSGVLLWCSSPAVGAGWIAWIAVVPAAYVALARAGTRAGRIAVPLAYAVQLELLLVPALPFGLAEGQWAHPPLPFLIGDSPLLPVALVLIPLFAALLYALRFGSPLTRLDRGGAVAAVLVPAAAWAALDFARTSVDPGAFWGPVFLSLHDRPGAGIAALAGPWLVTFAVVGVGYALALALALRRGAPLLVAAAAVAALAAAAGLEDASRGDPGAPVRVAAVQPGYDTAEDARPELRWFRPDSYDRASLDLIEDLGDQTRSAAARGARLVVWPEAAVWVDLARHPRLRAELAALARETGAALVVPYFDARARRSQVVAVTPAGRLGAARRKHRVMWYLGEHASAAGRGTLDAGVAELATLLGVDNGDPALPAKLVAAGAGLVASSTHDWKQLAVQQRSLAELHSISAGAPVVRADWRYGSAIYGRDGKLLADAGTERRRVVLVADVRVAQGPTVYGRLGDAFAWLCAAGWMAAIVAAAFRRRASPSRVAPRGGARSVAS